MSRTVASNSAEHRPGILKRIFSSTLLLRLSEFLVCSSLFGILIIQIVFHSPWKEKTYCKNNDECWVIVSILVPFVPMLVGILLAVVVYSLRRQNAPEELDTESAHVLERLPQRRCETSTALQQGVPSPLARPPLAYTTEDAGFRPSQSNVLQRQNPLRLTREVWNRRAAIIAAQDPPPRYSGQPRRWERTLEYNFSIEP